MARLESQKAASFTAYHWFRFYALRGHIQRLRGDFHAAAKDFFRAKKACPDLEKAQIVEALAHELEGRRDEAARLAELLKSEYPHSATALGLWLQWAPRSVTLDKLLEGIPHYLQDTAEVLMGLSVAAFERGDGRAEVFAQRAVEASPDWVPAKIHWATVVLAAVQWTPPDDLSEQQRTAISKARDTLTECIDKVRPHANPQYVAHQYLNVAVSCRLLKDHAAADEAVQAARRLAPNNEEVILREAQRLARHKKLDQAIQMLETVASPPLGLTLMAANLRGDRGAPGDYIAAARMLLSRLHELPADPREVEEAWIETIARLYLSAGEWSLAKEFLLSPRAVRVLTELVRSTFLGVAEHGAGNLDEARRHSAATLASVSDSAEPAEIVEAAHLFELLEDLDGAVDLYVRVVTPRSPTSVIRRSIAVAYRAGRHDFITKLGEALRQAGVRDLGVIEAELAVLEATVPPKAVGLIQEILESETEGSLSRYLRMRLSLLGKRLDRPELIAKDPLRLPSRDEILPYIAQAAIESILRSSDPLRAVAYAYELVRMHPDVEAYHRAMIVSMGLPGGGAAPPIPAVACAGPDSAVRLKEIPSDQKAWYVFEDTDQPKVSLNEVATKSRLAKAVFGRTVGEEVEFEEGFGTVRRVRLMEVVHKFVFRFQDCIKRMPERFPDQTFFKVFHVKEDAPPDEAFAEIASFMGKLSERRDELATEYRDKPLTLQVVANVLGSSLPAAISLISQKGDSVRCADGSQQARDGAIAAFRAATALVIEPTAIATAFLLKDVFAVDVFEAIDRWPTAIAVSEQALGDLERLQRDLSSGNPRMGATRVAGVWRPDVTSGERLAESAAKLGEIISQLRKHCTTFPASELSGIDPHLRADFAKICGGASAHSVSFARERGYVLWTDDAMVAALAANHLGLMRVWTQVVAQEVSATSAAVHEWFMRLSLGLLGLRYEFTWIDSDIARFAASQAAWNTNAWPLNRVVDLIGDPAVNVEGAARIAVQLLREVWINPVAGLQAINVTQRILDRLGKRQEGRDVVKSIYQGINDIFGLYVISAENLRRIIANWLRANNDGGGLILPR